MILLRIVFTWAVLLSSLAAYATRITGTVTDTQNEPLPFASIYVKGTTLGTTSNTEGRYFLDLSPGEYELIFRYVGFATQVQKVTVGDRNLILNVQLTEESLQLSEVVISPGGRYEDPAYGIMRNAIRRRKFYLNQVDAFSCDVYIKGVSRLTRVPERILGQELPTIAGMDLSKPGIIYLSESVSQYFYQRPVEKEIMISSKVSGNSRGFSWNSALDMKFNFYENLIRVEGLHDRGFVSPVSSNALFFYDYRLLGTHTDNGVQVHKIELIPKRTEDPVFRGNIYIQDKTWRIHSTELLLTKESKIDYVDTLHINQVYVPVNDSVWMMKTQRFSFNFRVLGVEGEGYFIGSMSNYEINPAFGKKFFKNEISRVEREANLRDSSYWHETRPVPLTVEEQLDYVRKDSLREIRESKAYLDSLDARSNRFKPMNLLTGYTYRNRYRRSSFSFTPIFNNIQFNTVEGLVLNPTVNYTSREQEGRRRFFTNNDLRYGFSGRQLYARTETGYVFNPVSRGLVQIAGGRYVSQFNEQEPISPFINTLYTLLREENFMKIYEKSFAELAYRQELLNGLYVSTSLEFAHRRPLENTTVFTLNDRPEVIFTPNTPVNAAVGLPFVDTHNALIYTLGVQFKFRQKYYSRPDMKLNLGSAWPTLTAVYKKGIPGVFNSVTNFDHLRVRLHHDFRLGLLGESRFDVAYGTFLNRSFVPFADFRHFLGNRTIIATNQLRAFYLLDYYTFSTVSDYWEGHYEHHFNGFLFNKIPYFRRLKLQEVAGLNFLRTPELGNYLELSAGIKNIFKVGRVDFVQSFGNTPPLNRTGIRFRVTLP